MSTLAFTFLSVKNPLSTFQTEFGNSRFGLTGKSHGQAHCSSCYKRQRLQQLFTPLFLTTQSSSSLFFSFEGSLDFFWTLNGKKWPCRTKAALFCWSLWLQFAFSSTKVRKLHCRIKNTVRCIRCCFCKTILDEGTCLTLKCFLCSSRRSHSWTLHVSLYSEVHQRRHI